VAASACGLRNYGIIYRKVTLTSSSTEHPQTMAGPDILKKGWGRCTSSPMPMVNYTRFVRRGGDLLKKSYQALESSHAHKQAYIAASPGAWPTCYNYAVDLNNGHRCNIQGPDHRPSLSIYRTVDPTERTAAYRTHIVYQTTQQPKHPDHRNAVGHTHTHTHTHTVITNQDDSCFFCDDDEDAAYMQMQYNNCTVDSMYKYN